MRALIFIISGLLTTVVRAQFTEDFTDGDFTNNPTWTGSTADFTVNAGNELQLNNSIAASSYLSTPNAMASLNDVEWQVWVQQSFSPSGGNYGRVYLVSDQSDLTGNLNGYYLQFGEGGSNDAIELFRQDGATSTSVARCTDGLIATSFEVRVRVRRDAAGNWEIGTDYSGGSTFTTEATGTDVTYTSSAHIGVFCEYTVSNADNFYYDDFYAGPYILDLTPPAVVSAMATSANQVDVQFDEPLDQTSAETIGNYSVDNGIGNPTTVTLDGVDPSLVHLDFGTMFTNGQTYTLTVQNVEDLAANAIGTETANFTYFVSGTPVFREVVINEIFPDPSPQLGMPDAEFIELHNTGSQIFDLNGWQISDGTSTATLDSYVLMPGEYVVLCPNADTLQFFFLPNVLGVTSFPSLNNSSDDLQLFDDVGTLIDRVIYSDTWYGDEDKADGGWTLEQINPTLPCSQVGNWTASVAVNNGTPGTQNSVYDPTPDTSAPSMVNVIAESAAVVKVALSENVDSTSAVNASYTISGGISVTTVSLNAALDSVQLLVSPALSQGVLYDLTMSGAQDCSGNTMASQTRSFILPEDPVAGDIIINEVLYDPVSGGSDYVELYNNSDKYLSLEGWYLADWEDSVNNLKLITTDFYLVEPGEFVLVSEDSSWVKQAYPFAATGGHINTDLPSYPNDSATVYLLLPDETISDGFSYDEDMQFDLLRSTDGVSLERIGYDRPTSDRTNWHSAAESQGYGTPGYENSQAFAAEPGGMEVEIAPEIFSPDNDGMDDVVSISYNMEVNGAVGTIRIFDAAGRVVRELVENELLGKSGTFSWDGINENAEKVRMGTYVILFEYFLTDGTQGAKKLAVVVAHRN